MRALASLIKYRTNPCAKIVFAVPISLSKICCYMHHICIPIQTKHISWFANLCKMSTQLSHLLSTLHAKFLHQSLVFCQSSWLVNVHDTLFCQEKTTTFSMGQLFAKLLSLFWGKSMDLCIVGLENRLVFQNFAKFYNFLVARPHW